MGIFGSKTFRTMVVGTAPNYLEVLNAKLDRGIFFKQEDLDEARRVCVLGSVPSTTPPQLVVATAGGVGFGVADDHFFGAIPMNLTADSVSNVAQHGSAARTNQTHVGSAFQARRVDRASLRGQPHYQRILSKLREACRGCLRTKQHLQAPGELLRLP